MGFYSNQFANQGGTYDQQCNVEQEYNVTFPVYGDVNVNPPEEHAVFTWLKAQPNGVGNVPWNFTKWLIDRDGNVTQRFEPATTPQQIRPSIEALL